MVQQPDIRSVPSLVCPLLFFPSEAFLQDLRHDILQDIDSILPNPSTED
jgi:hypothetical protein